MPGIFLLNPGPVFLDPNQQAVHENATIVASGEKVFTGYGASEVSLFVNVKAAPTGTLPTLQFTIQEVDPGDGVTVIGMTVSSSVITEPGIQRLTILSTFGGSITVSWILGGTTPSFTQVYATLVGKPGSVKLVDASGIEIGSTTNPLHIDPTGTTTQPVVAVNPDGSRAADTSQAAVESLVELKKIRKLLEILTDETIQDEECDP